MTAKTRTIAVQVSEETHLRFRCLRASTGMNSATLIAKALEAYTPTPDELEPVVREDVEALAASEAAIDVTDVNPVSQTEHIEELRTVLDQPIDLAKVFAELGIDPKGMASNPFD
jgi:hypothetical protein